MYLRIPVFYQSRFIPVALLLMALVCSSVVSAEETKDGQLFLDGFNAYQKKDFERAVECLSQVVNKYPRSPLRDTSYLMLAKTEFRAGNQPEAASYLALLFREYPDTPRWWIDEKLAKLLPEMSAGKTSPAPKVVAKTGRAAKVAIKAAQPAPSTGVSVRGDRSSDAGVIGYATFYRSHFNGKKTASGRPYRPNDLTAAFPQFPLGSKARVINLANLKEVVVTVNDRCPENDVPWITLSLAAADRLGFTGQKHAKVRIVPLQD